MTTTLRGIIAKAKSKDDATNKIRMAQVIVDHEEAHCRDPQTRQRLEAYVGYNQAAKGKDAAWEYGEVGSISANFVTSLMADGLLVQLFKSNGSKVYCLADRARMKQELIDAEVDPTADMVEATASIVQAELKIIAQMDREHELFLTGLLQDESRLNTAIEFGRTFSVKKQCEIYREMFGDELYNDAVLAYIHQYGLTNVPIRNKMGKPAGKTGFSQSHFGTPGTGKTFDIVDLIVGNEEEGVPGFGIPGKNRYCGGMSSAFFIRAGWAYEGRVINFIAPEFHQWFKYKDSMVDQLKLALEQKTIECGFKNDRVGPYRFTSYISANYNTAVSKTGYKLNMDDPNFVAIEDRCLCRLHKMDKARWLALAASKRRLREGLIDFTPMQTVRDHLTLVYAIQTANPLVQTLGYDPKPVLKNSDIEDSLDKISAEYIGPMPDNDILVWSPRLGDRAVKVAAAAAVMSYFAQDGPMIVIDGPEIEFAMQFYRAEIETRIGEVGK